jgi:hypothetical protein
MSPIERRKLSLELQSGSERIVADRVYNSSPWVSSGVFMLVGIAFAVLVVVTALVNREARHAHNEFTSLTVANIAVPTVHDRSFSNASLRLNRLIFLGKAIFPSTSNPIR